MVRHPSKKLEAKDLKKLLALGMLGLLVAFAMALGTSATFRDYKASRSVHIEVVADDLELVDLTPAQPYAYINGDGKLVIDFSKDNPNWPGNPDSDYYRPGWNETTGIGVSPDSRYNFDHVFNVSNHLWEDMNITVRVRSSGKILFYNEDEKIFKTGTNIKPRNSDTAHTYQADDVCFVLQPGESIGIGMDIFGGYEGSYNDTITIQAWPEGEEPFNCGGVLG